MFEEYGLPLAGIGWAVGHYVWLRVATGPQLVGVTGHEGNRVEILPLTSGMVMIVPAERLAWSYAEAVA